MALGDEFARRVVAGVRKNSNRDRSGGGLARLFWRALTEACSTGKRGRPPTFAIVR